MSWRADSEFLDAQCKKYIANKYKALGTNFHPLERKTKTCYSRNIKNVTQVYMKSLGANQDLIVVNELKTCDM